MTNTSIASVRELPFYQLTPEEQAAVRWWLKMGLEVEHRTPTLSTWWPAKNTQAPRSCIYRLKAKS